MGWRRWLVIVCVLIAFFGTAFGSQSAERVLVEKQNGSESASLLFARTERIDPLDGFKKYKGGFNITNKHYWSSAIFTGKYGYIVAAVWLVFGIVYAVILLIKSICFTGKQRNRIRLPHSNRCSFWPILSVLVFTILAIVASGVVLGGSSKFHSRAKTVKNIIVRTAEEASNTIHNVTGAAQAMQDDMVLYGDLAGSTNLNATSKKLNDEADNIQRKAIKNMRLVNKGLKILKAVTIVTVTLNLVVVLALLVFLIARTWPKMLRRAFNLLIIICWLLTFLFWLYFGLYYFLNKFAGDTCIALNEYQLDPQNSTLGSILPCRPSAKSVLRDAGEGIHDIINQVNANISALQSLSLPGLQYVCNPFSGPPDYTYQPENCSSNTIQIGDIPQVLKRYTCSNNGSNDCVGEFISTTDYNRAVVYTNSLQNILNSYPSVERLVNCQLVKDAFSEILVNHCKPLKRDVHVTWGALAALSTVMVILILAWIFEACYGGRGNKNSYDGSVEPHSTSSETSEADTSELASRDIETKLVP
ncbi:putative transmembrane protein [Dioscorea sansibarensis]